MGFKTSYSVGCCRHCIREKEKEREEKPLHSSTLPIVGNFGSVAAAESSKHCYLDFSCWLSSQDSASWDLSSSKGKRRWLNAIYQHYKEKFPIFSSPQILSIGRYQHIWHLRFVALAFRWRYVAYITNKSWNKISSASSLCNFQTLNMAWLIDYIRDTEEIWFFKQENKFKVSRLLKLLVRVYTYPVFFGHHPIIKYSILNCNL